MWIPQSLALIAPVLAYRHYVVLSPSMSRSEADKACQSHGWKLANLDGFKHAEMILLESGAKGGWISTISGRNPAQGRALLMKRATGRITVALVPDCNTDDCTTDNCKLFRAPAICEAKKTDHSLSKSKATSAAKKHRSKSKKPEKSKQSKKSKKSQPTKSQSTKAKPRKTHRKSTTTGKKSNVELVPRQVQSILATFGDFSNSENEKIINGIKDDLLEGKQRDDEYCEEDSEKGGDEQCDGSCGLCKPKIVGSRHAKKLRKRGYSVNEGKRHRKNGVNLAALQSIIEKPSSSSTSTLASASSGTFSPIQSLQDPSSRYSRRSSLRSPQRRRVISTKQRKSKNSRKLKSPGKSTSTKQRRRPDIQKKSPARRTRLPIGTTYSRSHSSSSLDDSISYNSFAEQIYASSSDGPAAIFRHRSLYRHIRHSSSSSSSLRQLPASRLETPILPRSMRGELQRTTRTLDIAGRQADLDAMRAKRREKLEMRRQEREARNRARGSKNKEGGLRNAQNNTQETPATNAAANSPIQPVATIIP